MGSGKKRTAPDWLRPVAEFSSWIGLLLLTCATALVPAAYSQTQLDLQSFLQNDIGLSQQEMVNVRTGQPVTKVLPSRTPSELFFFGVVYIQSAPKKYANFVLDFDRLRKLPNYVALGVLSNPPKLSDFRGFSFDTEDIRAIHDCKPENCLIQLPASAIQDFQRLIDWSAADAEDQVNRVVQSTALERIVAYQREGNKALGAYNDKRNPTDVAGQFKYMLQYSKAFPRYLPEFYEYLLTYPDRKPSNVEDTFYWAKVKFGLKPTLRVVQVSVMSGNAGDQIAYVIAEKQLYSSHYFETALDLSFCIREMSEADAGPGFYLIKVMSSEQAGLTGIKGSVVRKAAVGRSASALHKLLILTKSTLEHKS